MTTTNTGERKNIIGEMNKDSQHNSGNIPIPIIQYDIYCKFVAIVLSITIGNKLAAF